MSSRPSVLFLHVHNTGRNIGPYGYAIPTPHLQDFAQQGILYRRAYCASPTCSPSRASFLTGTRPLRCGMLGLGNRGFRLTRPEWHLGSLLRQQGYGTYVSGIEHLGPGIEDEVYTARLDAGDGPARPDCVEAAIRFLGSAPSEPFFLSLGLHEAHRGYPEPEPAKFPAEDERYILPPRPLPDTAAIRREMSGYIALVRRMDEKIGKVLAALDAAGRSKNTLVCIFADHGLQFPRNMCSLTERGLGVFLMIRGPGGFAGGVAEDRMVSLLDLYPTVCSLAGMVPPPWVEGRNLQRLQESVEPLHKELFGEINYHAAYEPTRCVYTDRYRLVRRYGGRTQPVWPNEDPGGYSASFDYLKECGWADFPQPAEGLYDLVFDPEECNNLVNDPCKAQVREELQSRLSHWMKSSDDPLLDARALPVPPDAVANHPDDPTWSVEPRRISDMT